MGDDRPLENGYLADTPVGDTLFRRFLFNQADLNAELARVIGGRVERDADVALVDTGGPVPYYNQATLFRPLDEPLLNRVESFFEGRPCNLLSIWPTDDLSARGWTLVGHPACVARSPSPVAFEPPADVEVRVATSAAELAEAERLVVEGYPMPGMPTGSLLPESLLDGPVRVRLGLLDGEPVAVGLVFVAHGVVNLCMGATLPAARRRKAWESLVWARAAEAPDLPTMAYTSDYSRPGFERMGFMPLTRFTLWMRG